MPKHISVARQDTIEYVQQTVISPLVSKGVAKVLYLGENRNGTFISKETALEMGQKLPGSPVVGYYNDSAEDFEEHSRKIEITRDKFEILDLTKPYGFVPTDSKIWFQVFVDDGIEHEYLCCEVYLWTVAYPECQRVFADGNNQSMELNNDSMGGVWTNSANGKGRIFIINEALIEKLCILGEDFEPCFEGGTIQKEFSLQLNNEIEQLRASMFSLMTEVEKALNEGGTKMHFTVYAVQIGDATWGALYNYLKGTYPQEDGSIYSILGVYEDGTQKFAMLQGEEEKLYRMNFVLSDVGLAVDSNMQEVDKDYVDSYAFSVEDNKNYKKKEDESEQENSSKSDNKSEDDSSDDDNGKDDEEEDKKKYSLNDIPEYLALQQKYASLKQERDSLNQIVSALSGEVEELHQFKLATERVSKENKIQEFYMLSDEDKKDCIENIDNYSLEEIESKLAVICYRNKVSFVDPSENAETQVPTAFSLADLNNEDNSVPEWVKTVRLNQNKEEF